jgi:hypothetical protein
MKTSQESTSKIKDAANPEPLPEGGRRSRTPFPLGGLGKRCEPGASLVCEVTRRFPTRTRGGDDVFALPALFFLLVLPFFVLALVALAASQLASGVAARRVPNR